MSSLTFLPRSSFAVRLIAALSLNCLQRAETCANCSLYPALSTFETNFFWDKISHGTWVHLSKKYSWFWLICLNYSGIPEFMRKLNSHVNGKITSNNAKNWSFRVGESWVYKKWQTAAMIREIFNSNTDTGRNGPESGVSQIVRKSWQHCHCRLKLGRVGNLGSLHVSGKLPTYPFPKPTFCP